MEEIKTNISELEKQLKKEFLVKMFGAEQNISWETQKVRVENGIGELDDIEYESICSCLNVFPKAVWIKYEGVYYVAKLIENTTMFVVNNDILNDNIVDVYYGIKEV